MLLVDHHEDEIKSIIDHTFINKITVDKTGEIFYNIKEDLEPLICQLMNFRLRMPSDVNKTTKALELFGQRVIFWI
jgi:hypothetical protein